MTMNLRSEAKQVVAGIIFAFEILNSLKFLIQNHLRIQTLIDSSHIITFCVSISVIIYGSFKSLNIDSDNEQLINDLNNKTKSNDVDDSNSQIENFHSQHQNTQTLDSIHAVIIPIAASISLLLMFFFFDSIQTAFLLCTSSNIALLIHSYYK
jgi:hypothetical protein